ncbi:uncharacterized protein LOC143238784 isoform X2 [Tachypleus tridentatus]|uniref:uncharacterized protein LOC143238784 isoform X2 n=1 Tax=Tachypleus tridentatus TaxID=6853 RepID=UPI003FD44B3F
MATAYQKRHGEIIFLEEIDDTFEKHHDFDGKTIRITAKLENHFPVDQKVTLISSKPVSCRQLEVDTSLLPPTSYIKGSLYQFIGELKFENQKIKNENKL